MADVLYSSFFFSPRHNIRCSKLQFCHNLIIVPHPVGWPRQLWDCDALLLYNNPSSPLRFSPSLISSSRLLFVYADEPSKHSSLPPLLPSPLSGVTSLPFLLCKETKRAQRALKIQLCLGSAPLINIDSKPRERGLCVHSAPEQLVGTH